jgi:Rod binding domain-containing protein
MAHAMNLSLTLPTTSVSNQKGAGLDQKISKSAKEFESLLLTNWLQAAEQSFGTVPGEDADEDPGKEQFQSFSIQSLAAEVTKAGGIGLASSIERQLRHAAGAAATPPGQAKPEGP